MSTPIGIDFGTSKTLVTWINPDNGHPTAIRLGRGRDEIPTTAYLCDDGTLLFGDDADDNAQFDFSNYARGFKLSLGSTTPLLLGVSRRYSAMQLTCSFLSHIKERCEKEAVMGKVGSAVITVPAIFSPAQREELVTAAKGAGFSSVELLSEPVAAGMAFCTMSPKDAFEGSILVVDWGGGTLDLAVVSRGSDGRFETVQGLVAGGSGIGGEAFDEAMWKLVTERLAQNGGVDLAAEPMERRGAQLASIRQAKEMLSMRDEHRVTLSTTRGPKGTVVSRSEFNSAIMGHVAQGAAKAFEIISAARKRNVQPLFVLLVGGTCKVPLIHQAIEAATKMECRVWQYSREAVAFGAALAATTSDDPETYFNLALKYYYGEGVPQDFVQAVIWFRKAADQGQAGGQFRLGLSYSNGEGVPQDYVQAVNWYRKAADQGNANAQNYLGLMCCRGHGVPQDKVQAVMWWHKAAELGNADSENYLGIMHWLGYGVPQDKVKAAIWWRRAVEHGHEDAKKNLAGSQSVARFGFANIPSQRNRGEGSYKDRKFPCPKCSKVMILDPQEYRGYSYTCPYCHSSGSVDFGFANIPSQRNRGEGSYKDRKFPCPKCSKVMILDPQEYRGYSYTCPYCHSSGRVDVSFEFDELLQTQLWISG